MATDSEILEDVRKTLKWVSNDLAYKAPEIWPQAAASGLQKVHDAAFPEETS